MRTVPCMLRLCSTLLAAALLPIILLAGCTAAGPVRNPVARNLTWYSYLEGEDLHAACAADGRDRYRLVYNVAWGVQVRTYDLIESATGEGAVLISRVFGAPDFRRLNAYDPFGPWRGVGERSRLSAAEYGRVRVALHASGFEAPAPAGLWLRSDESYWVIAACVDGQDHFHAWTAEAPDFESLPFLRTLLPFDATRVDVAPARRAVGPFQQWNERTGTAGEVRQRFRAQVDEDGLVSGPRF